MGALTVARPKRTPRAAKESTCGVFTTGFTLPRASQRYWSAIRNSMFGLRCSLCGAHPANRRAKTPAKAPPAFKKLRLVSSGPRPDAAAWFAAWFGTCPPRDPEFSSAPITALRLPQLRVFAPGVYAQRPAAIQVDLSVQALRAGAPA